ncbi:GNAT family N-acetyltransferase [Mucilaginibacter sp. KACC 22063]|uniref:GNAT family N-acetyltransferase n=1 Tax=Mucilaginibacter sp. KACC 22063 TaxID=3025666 RepID=UPI0023663945|nr:GNAT family N-acetyltransferase [Mucilaginibacter sp. KACC 22063]WDF53538.1 GNAT family N-acetyltransferase [Mucilaginibacter sp. KACC 22063]
MPTLPNIHQLLSQGYLISTDKALFDIDEAFDMIANRSYWAIGMPRERFETAVKNSLLFGVYHNGVTVGMARVISDYGTFAYICDVFIDEAHRGRGLSKWLVSEIMSHPDLQGLRRWSLATSTAHGLYSQYGFVPISKPQDWMEIRRPYIQQNEGN